MVNFADLVVIQKQNLKALGVNESIGINKVDPIVGEVQPMKVFHFAVDVTRDVGQLVIRQHKVGQRAADWLEVVA